MFKQAVNLILNKEHLNIEGLYKIVNIKASMNLGLSNILKSEFNKFTPIKRPIISTENIPDPNWISGFVTGDRNFDANIPKLETKRDYRVQLRFRITQHDRDIKLMEKIIKYIGSGNLYKYSINLQFLLQYLILQILLI